MTSGESFENKWFYMKYIGKYLSAEILLTLECSCVLMVSIFPLSTIFIFDFWKCSDSGMFWFSQMW